MNMKKAIDIIKQNAGCELCGGGKYREENAEKGKGKGDERQKLHFHSTLSSGASSIMNAFIGERMNCYVRCAALLAAKKAENPANTSISPSADAITVAGLHQPLAHGGGIFSAEPGPLLFCSVPLCAVLPGRLFVYWH